MSYRDGWISEVQDRLYRIWSAALEQCTRVIVLTTVQVWYSPDTRPRRGQLNAAVLTSFLAEGFRVRRVLGIRAWKIS